MKSKFNNIPKDGLAGLKENWIGDLISGLIVSFLALPLSLGIAKASGWPNPMYGVLTAIIGGILVTFISGSRLSIKGPAAGLIVICVGAVTAFGGGEIGWHMALGAIVVAAVIQILFGVFKLGNLVDFFPLSVVHGMLAAIGLIIIVKQIYALLGLTLPLGEDGKQVKEIFDIVIGFPKALTHIQENMKVAITGLVSLVMVLGLPPLFKNSKLLKKIPVPLLVLIVAIPLGLYLGLTDVKGGLISFDKPFTEILGWNVSFEGIKMPGVFIKYVILFALVGSLESLLTAKAVDLLDPFRRKSDFNKDVIGVGAGNALSGILGGLPMISEVARSSNNVSNGAKTRWANLFHGVFLLLYMLILTSVIQLIPNAALAAMLVGVGYKLTHPKEFIHMFKIGGEQLAIFVITILVTLATDLLMGIGAGILVKLIIHLLNGMPLRSAFKSKIETISENGSHEIFVKESAVFSNYIVLKKNLDAYPRKERIVIDFSDAKLVDHTVMENLKHYQNAYIEEGGQFELRGLEEHKPFSSYPTAARKITA